jgi:hypothetical protein
MDSENPWGKKSKKTWQNLDVAQHFTHVELKYSDKHLYQLVDQHLSAPDFCEEYSKILLEMQGNRSYQNLKESICLPGR